MTVPAAVPVNVTEHEPTARVHVGALNVPAAPVLDHVTVPVGVIGVPAAEVSVTVAVHVDPWLTITGLVQDTAVDEVLRLTVIDALVELVACVESPP